MRSKLYIAAVAMAASQAFAFEPPKAVGLHLVSHHFEPRQRGEWNDKNQGVYLAWAGGLVVGTYHNSENARSVYVGQVWETARWGGAALDLTLGAVTGYGRPVAPLAAVGVNYQLGQAKARISFAPKAAKTGSAVAHLTIEYSF